MAQHDFLAAPYDLNDAAGLFDFLAAVVDALNEHGCSLHDIGFVRRDNGTVSFFVDHGSPAAVHRRSR